MDHQLEGVVRSELGYRLVRFPIDLGRNRVVRIEQPFHLTRRLQIAKFKGVRRIRVRQQLNALRTHAAPTTIY